VTEKNEREMISRRGAFSILGMAALSLTVSPMVLAITDAEAQPNTTTAQAPQTGTTPTPQTGTQRRQERRTARTERRQERRTARAERRTERRTGRTERRQQRHGTAPTTSTTPQ
jgi:hypothetical protein